MPVPAQSKIVKKGNSEPDQFELSIAQALLELQNNSDLKAQLRELYITKAKEIELFGKKVSYRSQSVCPRFLLGGGRRGGCCGKKCSLPRSCVSRYFFLLTSSNSLPSRRHDWRLNFKCSSDISMYFPTIVFQILFFYLWNVCRYINYCMFVQYYLCSNNILLATLVSTFFQSFFLNFLPSSIGTNIYLFTFLAAFRFLRFAYTV